MHRSRIALVLRLGPEAGDASSRVVGVELELQANGILTAAHETDARVGLFVHDVFSSCRLHYNIDARLGRTSPIPSSRYKAS
jgi:hypothetical protein